MSVDVGTHWTRMPKGSEHMTLQPYLEELKRNYRDARLSWFEVFLGLYTDQQDVSVLSSRATVASSPLYAQQAVPINIAMPIVDTAEAKIAGSTRPRPYFKAVGANNSQKRKCLRLQKFIDGEFDRTKAYRIGSQMVKDAGIFGIAGCQPYIRDGKICLDRVLASELIVDENLAFDASPRELTRCREVSKSLLADRYPKFEDKIMALTTIGSAATQWSDLVEVCETWSLPRGDKPGKHVVTIPTATLVSEPYTKDYFPIVLFRWSEMPTGFYGQGLIHQIMGIQLEITRWFRNISKSLHVLANPRVLLPNGGNLDPNHLTNAWGTILKYQPPYKPEIWTSQIMPPEVYQWFENMYAKAFERVGMSTQAAFAKKPSGVESGKAMRELSDIQADRLAPVSVRYEGVYLDLAIRYIDLAEQLFEEDPEFSTVFQGTRNAERLRWSDVRLDKDDYTIQLFATAFLSRTPGAAFDDIKDLMAAELIDANEARALLNFPDLQRIFDLENAARDNYEKIVELIIDKGVSLSPQPYDGLDGLKLGLKVMKEAYSRARTEEVEESKLEMMRQWLDKCLDMIAAEEAKLAPPPQEAPPPQAAAPAPMPTEGIAA